MKQKPVSDNTKSKEYYIQIIIKLLEEMNATEVNQMYRIAQHIWRKGYDHQ